MSVRLASCLPWLSIENGWIDDIDRFSCTKSVDLVVSAYHKACVYKATSLLQARWASCLFSAALLSGTHQPCSAWG